MKKVGSIITQYFKQRDLPGLAENLAWASIWRRVTGKNIERCTRPVALKNGVLFVEVEDSVWLYQLSLLKEKIIADFNAAYGEKLLSDINFRSTGYALSSDNVKKKVLTSCKKNSPGQIHKPAGEDLGESEIKEIEKLICLVPEFSREKINSLLNGFYRMQQWKKLQGAISCSHCHSLFFTKGGEQGKESLCPVCRHEKQAF